MEKWTFFSEQIVAAAHGSITKTTIKALRDAAARVDFKLRIVKAGVTRVEASWEAGTALYFIYDDR